MLLKILINFNYNSKYMKIFYLKKYARKIFRFFINTKHIRNNFKKYKVAKKLV